MTTQEKETRIKAAVDAYNDHEGFSASELRRDELRALLAEYGFRGGPKEYFHVDLGSLTFLRGVTRESAWYKPSAQVAREDRKRAGWEQAERWRAMER